MATRLGSEEQFYIHDTSARTLVGAILFPFAYDELMCRKIGDGAAPLVHVWRHEKALVLGLRDRRLPMAEMGMRWLSAQGYEVGVRNSGGAAVPLDPGVLNISLILPNAEGKPNFQAGFEQMRQLLVETLQRFGVEIEAGEVAGSYCPGDFDLSIDGRKFCGISQRRQHKAYAVQAFVVVEGHAERRAQMVRMFYEMATGEENSQLADGIEDGGIGELGDAGIAIGADGADDGGTSCQVASEDIADEDIDTEGADGSDDGGTSSQVASEDLADQDVDTEGADVSDVVGTSSQVASEDITDEDVDTEGADGSDVVGIAQPQAGVSIDTEALPTKDAQLSYPKIRTGSMGSLVSLASGKGITVRTFALALQQTLQEWGGSTARHPQLPSMDELQKKAAELKQRYDN